MEGWGAGAGSRSARARAAGAAATLAECPGVRRVVCKDAERWSQWLCVRPSGMLGLPWHHHHLSPFLPQASWGTGGRGAGELALSTSPGERNSQNVSLQPEFDTQGWTPARKSGARAVYRQITWRRDFKKSLALLCCYLTLCWSPNCKSQRNILEKKSKNKIHEAFFLNCLYSCRCMSKTGFISAKWHSASAHT